MRKEKREVFVLIFFNKKKKFSFDLNFVGSLYPDAMLIFHWSRPCRTERSFTFGRSSFKSFDRSTNDWEKKISTIDRFFDGFFLLNERENSSYSNLLETFLENFHSSRFHRDHRHQMDVCVFLIRSFSIVHFVIYSSNEQTIDTNVELDAYDFPNRFSYFLDDKDLSKATVRIDLIINDRSIDNKRQKLEKIYFVQELFVDTLENDQTSFSNRWTVV